MSPNPGADTVPELLDDVVTRAVYATDNSIYQIEPHGVTRPRRGSEIEALLRANHASAEPRPIVARGAGTGTNGQSLTDGIIIDTKRHLNQVITVDVEARTAVVQPGLVTAALNAQLAPHGLFWAPHASTLNRATVGGMISTDAAGKGSLVHGRAARHVLALDVVLDDGTPWRAVALPLGEAQELAEGDGRIAALWRELLALPIARDGNYDLPELARGFSGYGIDRFRRFEGGEEIVDPVPLLAGSEGTLAVITAATLALTPLPAKTVLMVASYDSFAEALDDAVDLAVTKPTAIESFDETTLERGRSSPAWPALGAVVGDHAGSVLLLEYSGEEEPDLAPIVATLARTGRSLATKAITDPRSRAAVWKVRADAVGLLAKIATGAPEHSARPTAFVEDCAVPVREMPTFIARFRALLDGHGLQYGMFGHADVGCVHVRPALDLNDPDHQRMVRTITDQVVALVAEHGGVLWGEHGRGFRGDSAETFLNPDTIQIMRGVKQAFDPTDRLNPGKLYRPLSVGTPITAFDGVPLRGHQNQKVSIEVRNAYDHAFACNGNGLCHHYDAAEVMCPSYKATGDPALSPKGRADLIRTWLSRTADPDADRDELVELEEALASNLDQCLSCSACTGHCPVEVDIPELKSRFFERYYATRRRPPAHQLLSRFEQLARVGSLLPSAASRLGGPLVGRALGLVGLPAPPGGGILKRRGGLPVWAADGDLDVVIMPDVFTSNLEPSTTHQAIAVLESLGYAVAVAPFVASGKFDHVKGNRSAFVNAAKAQAAQVRAIVASGAVPTVIEPAVGLMHGHEYPNILDDYPRGEVKPLVEVIEQRLDRLVAVDDPQTVIVMGHCTERATAPDQLAAWGRVLGAIGHDVQIPDLGCCGMAGIFGHEQANQDLSREIFDLSWKPELESLDAEARAPVAVATGYSCRTQVKRLTPRPIAHPLSLINPRS